MISLTKFDGHPLVVNEAHILYVEHTPDTMLTLTNGAHILVKDTVEDVVAKVVEFRHRVIVGPPPVKAPDAPAASDAAAGAGS